MWIDLKKSATVHGRLRSARRKGRRKTIYKMLAKKHAGKVPCFVCGDHVAPEDATLEHILEQRNGGGDEMENLSISHDVCNRLRQKIENSKG